MASIAGVRTLALPSQAGSQMDGQIAEAVKQIGALVKAFQGHMGVAAIDLGTGETIAVNADARFPAASTIKTAVMIEAWQQAADGRLSMDTPITLRETDKVAGAGVLRGLHGSQGGLVLTVSDLVHLMIVLSDNTATNLLIGRLGTARVNERLEAYGLKETKLFRPTFRDGRADVLPELEREFGLGMTTPREMARLMAVIAEGKAVNRGASDAMLATLRRQQDRAMIPRLITSDDRIQIGNKTGTDEEKHPLKDGVKRHVRADAAIVTGPGFSYVIAIYARQVEDTRWGVDNDALTTGARISKMVYEHFVRKQ
jgi:beta-lactamase class A